MEKEVILEHIGVARRSGRYPWGSGKDPQRSGTIYGRIDELKAKGFKGGEAELAKALGMNTSQFRAAKSAATAEIREANFARCNKMSAEGMSIARIVNETGIPEATVRGYIKNQETVKKTRISDTTESLKAMVENKNYIDVGAGSEIYMGISRTQLNNAVTLLANDPNSGYKVESIQVPQLGTKIGQKTTIKVLTKDEKSIKDIYDDREQISVPNMHALKDSADFVKFHKPIKIDMDKIGVVYTEDGGSERDGLMLLRPGAENLDLGNKRYAQVRIAAGEKSYLKGMAMYDTEGLIPKGQDILFYTNKSKTNTKEEVFKNMKKGYEDSDDPSSAFGSSIQKQRGALNIVNEEGSWMSWSSGLSSQMLSKQRPSLVKEQLEKTLKDKQREYDEIMSLTNPVVKAQLLKSFSEDVDANAVSLKALGLPRTSTHVFIPFPEIPDGQIYAPKYKDGERLVIIRHPHGGVFEIPELVVNNKIPSVKKALGDAVDAVGINKKAADQLSGADFDGDAGLVIPNNNGKIKTQKMLKELETFDTKLAYPGYDGMKIMSDTQKQMGVVSNLLTDMQLKGAPLEDVVKVVKHSMVVIDAEKHGLNYKQSEIDNNIKAIKAKYQAKDPETGQGGASTLISRASQDVRINERKVGYTKQDIDPVTGERTYKETGNSYIDPKTGTTVFRQEKVSRLSITPDAKTLSQNSPIENLYADFSNDMKALGNQARLSWLEQPNIKYDPDAARLFAPEVESLNQKLNTAKSNAPLERQAQIVGNSMAQEIIKSQPNLTKSEISSINAKSLTRARSVVGAGKETVKITEAEWDAIQNGALSNSKVVSILSNADEGIVRQLATPKATQSMSSTSVSRASQMIANGNSISSVAEALGVSTSTIIKELNLGGE